MFLLRVLEKLFNKEPCSFLECKSNSLVYVLETHDIVTAQARVCSFWCYAFSTGVVQSSCMYAQGFHCRHLVYSVWTADFA